MTAAHLAAIPLALAWIILLAVCAWLLWPRDDAPRPRREPLVEPGIAAWEQDCAERKRTGRWKWGRQK